MNLFEYQNSWYIADEEAAALEVFLNEIWKNRERNDYFRNDAGPKSETQQFISISRRVERKPSLKCKNYVGVIRFNKKEINLLPKVFFNPDSDVVDDKKPNAINKHLLWWLSYCRRLKFPNVASDLDRIECKSFFEVLIYIFSKYTKEVLANSVYQQYIEVEEELDCIRGRLDINRYITQNLATGRWHKLSCCYDSFEIDSKFNRILKYVTKMLVSETTSEESIRNLNDILFILDEVSDVRVTAEDCLQIQFNPMFEDLEKVRDFCYLFLSSSVSYNYMNRFKLFAFLLPMEYLFEDFIRGFMEKEVKNLTFCSEKVYLAVKEREGVFSLQPDYKIKYGENMFIADAKYKIIYNENDEKKKVVSQHDLYQVITYALRFGINKVILFYPHCLSEMNKIRDTLTAEFTIVDELCQSKKEILIHVHKLPIINKDLLNSDNELSASSLEKCFEGTKDKLIDSIVKALNGFTSQSV
jgi:5-methylcytosine-specific restriction enzyme subunit McrC